MPRPTRMERHRQRLRKRGHPNGTQKKAPRKDGAINEFANDTPEGNRHAEG